MITPSLLLPRLKELLRMRLRESGWRDNLKEHCKGKLTIKYTLEKYKL